MIVHTPSDNAPSDKLGLEKVKAAQKQGELSKNALQECLDNSNAILHELQSSLRGKVADSQFIVDAMNGRIDSMSKCISSLKQSHDQLAASLHARQGPMTLCAWRMGQRERRPLREHTRDAVAVALEEERTSLFNMDKKINEAMKDTVSMISTMQISRDRIFHDLHLKKHAMKVDELTLHTHGGGGFASSAPPGPPLPTGNRPTTPSGRPGSRPRSAGSSQFSRPSSMGSRPRSAGPGVGRRVPAASQGHEFKCQQEVRRMQNDVSGREQAAKERREENQRLCRLFEQIAVEAKAKTETVLKEHVSTLQQAKKRLETETAETKKKLHNAQTLISETKTQIEQLEEPMTLCCRHSKPATKNARGSDQAADPVAARLQEQKHKLIQTTKDLRDHRLLERGLLIGLDDHLERLKEDLKDKTAALAIDLNCLRQSKSNNIPLLKSGRLPFAL